MLQIHPYSIEVKLIKEEILKNLKIDQNSLPIYQNPLPIYQNQLSKRKGPEQIKANITGPFNKDYSEIEKKENANKFCNLLSNLQTYQWASKYMALQESYLEKISQYSQYVQTSMMNFSEFEKIKFTNKNVKQTQFSIIHYGIYNEELIVIKECNFGQQNPDQVFISLLCEISILTFCNHPNIIKLKGVYFNKDSLKIYLIFPRYFKDLQCSLQQETITKKKQLCLQLIEAIIYIHKNGFLHLDLKPSNVIFENSFLQKILLLDFGISKIPEDQSQPTQIQGITLGYAAPEINKSGKSNVSQKSDIFSLGIVLYELITEKKAWKNQPENNIYELIHSQAYVFFEENDRTGLSELDSLIEECVNSNQELRPTATQLLERIQQIQF